MATTGKRNVEEDTQEEGMMMDLGLLPKCFSRSYILNKFSIHGCRADHFQGAIMGTNSILTEVRTTGGSYQTLDKVAFAAFGEEGVK